VTVPITLPESDWAFACTPTHKAMRNTRAVALIACQIAPESESVLEAGIMSLVSFSVALRLIHTASLFRLLAATRLPHLAL
jgi:hypothetical protein